MYVKCILEHIKNGVYGFVWVGGCGYVWVSTSVDSETHSNNARFVYMVSGAVDGKVGKDMLPFPFGANKQDRARSSLVRTNSSRARFAIVIAQCPQLIEFKRFI